MGAFSGRMLTNKPYSRHSLPIRAIECEMARQRTRMSFCIDFGSEMEKSAFTKRLESVRSLLSTPGLRKLDNCQLLTSLFDIAEGSQSGSLPGGSRAAGEQPFPASTRASSEPEVSLVQSFNRDAGKKYLAIIIVSL